MNEQDRGQVMPLHLAAVASVIALLIITAVMLSALFTRTSSHPPIEVPPFALGPFLGASLSIGGAVVYLVLKRAPYCRVISLLFALSALVSFGPQKFFDPWFSRVWPAVITAQLAVLVILVWFLAGFKRRDMF